jgi:hypothetical protein
MALITVADLTFNGDEIKSLSEAVFESGFSKPELSKFHTVVNGIVQKKQIVILGRLSGLVGLGAGGCDPASATNTIGMSEKFWEPVTVSDRFTACWTDLEASFWAYGLKIGVQKADLTATEFFMFVQDLVTDAIQEAIYRIAWFSDVDAADYNDSPAGVLTNGTALGYFNKIDGLFKQIFAIVGADANRKTAGLATKNAAVSFALQAFDSTDTTNKVVTNTLQNMKYGADYRLREKAGLVYVVTQSVADQYERELIASNVAFTTERLENGITLLKSGGIEVFSFNLWDRIIRSYYSNGTKYYLPHRAILLTPDNIQIGTEESAQMSGFDVIFDRTTKKNHIDFAFNIDAKVIVDYEIQAAY